MDDNFTPVRDNGDRNAEFLSAKKTLSVKNYELIKAINPDEGWTGIIVKSGKDTPIMLGSGDLEELTKAGIIKKEENNFLIPDTMKFGVRKGKKFYKA